MVLSNGFSEISENEMMETDGGSALLFVGAAIGFSAAGTAVAAGIAYVANNLNNAYHDGYANGQRKAWTDQQMKK